MPLDLSSRIVIRHWLRPLKSNLATSFLDENWIASNTDICIVISANLYIWLLPKPGNYRTFYGDQHVMLKQSLFFKFVRENRTCPIPCQTRKGVQSCHEIVSAGYCCRRIVCETDKFLKDYEPSLIFFALCLKEFRASGSKTDIVREISKTLVIAFSVVEYETKTWAAK